MNVSYFVVNGESQLQRVACGLLEKLWKGNISADAIGCDLDDELRLITVLSDQDLQPVFCYFVRLDLKAGKITDESRIEAFEAMTARHRRRKGHPAARRQLEGWPTDWRPQMAVALDVPVVQLNKIGLGGPLLMSELWGLPLEKVIEYFEDAYEA